MRKLYLTLRFASLLLFSVVLSLSLVSFGLLSNQVLFWCIVVIALMAYTTAVHLIADKFVEKHYGIKVRK